MCVYLFISINFLSLSFVVIMKCVIPEIFWHNRDPVLSVDIQPKPLEGDNKIRLASGGYDSHVLVSNVLCVLHSHDFVCYGCCLIYGCRCFRCFVIGFLNFESILFRFGTSAKMTMDYHNWN